MMKIKDYSHKSSCLTCNGFCWWDGDYCCTMKMKIHQYGYPNGIWFNRDIDKTMETPETCEDYSYRHHERYPESENEYIEEYKKFKIWDRLYKQLEDHVSDTSGFYEIYKSNNKL